MHCCVDEDRLRYARYAVVAFRTRLPGSVRGIVDLRPLLDVRSRELKFISDS